MSSFRTKTFNERLKESQKVFSLYPNRLPIVIDKKEHSRAPTIDKHKFLVPKDLNFGQFQYIIRKRLALDSRQSLFMFANNTMVMPTQDVTQLYTSFKSND